MEEEIGNF